MPESPSSKTRSFLLYWLPVLLWMGVIFALSSQDKDQSKGLSDTFLFIFRLMGLDPVQMQELGIPHLVRKMAHVTEYFILYLLVHRLIASYSPQKSSLLWALLVCVLYAASDEYHQSFVPGRGADVLDVGIDSIGMTIALLLKWKKSLNSHKQS
ncbi:MAG: VanZ family protein [Bacteroidia bacterium]